MNDLRTMHELTIQAILREVDEAIWMGNVRLAEKILTNPDNEDVLDRWISENEGLI